MSSNSKDRGLPFASGLAGRSENVSSGVCVLLLYWKNGLNVHQS